MANPVFEFLQQFARRLKGESLRDEIGEATLPGVRLRLPKTAPLAQHAVPPQPAPSLPVAAPSPAEVARQAFLEQLKAKVATYLQYRQDGAEQQDHLRHVAARTRWLYTSELQREAAGQEVTISARDNALIEACVYSHDIGKWIPRETLRTLFSDVHEVLDPLFQELHFTPDQTELFLLGVRRRFNLPQDGHTPEYDAAHHLVSAYILVTDPALGFHQLEPADQTQVIAMVVGHQFGSYFKGSLLNLSLYDREVTTGMLIETARSDRLMGDKLSSAFHDADISDLLFVGSLENLPHGADRLHTGGLVKILMINFTNLIHQAPLAPTNLEEVLVSCQNTVNNACKEFLTATATECGHVWRDQARQFLDFLYLPDKTERINATLQAADQTPAQRVAAVRALTHTYAKLFLEEQEGR